MQIIFTNIWNTINNSAFLSVVVSSIIIYLFIYLIVYTLKLLNNIRIYIENKSKSFYLTNQKNTPGNVSLSMPERVELTNSILDLISFMINNEIISNMKMHISLNNLYDVSNLDVDVKNISEIVFNGINKDLFKDPNLILTEDYLMEFITKKTISTMLDVVQTHNDNIRGANQSDRD